MARFLVQALQYKTDQIADIKKIEKLNLLFFTLMSQGSDAESEPSSLFHKVHDSNRCTSIKLPSILTIDCASCHMKWSQLCTLQVYCLGFAFSKPTFLGVIEQYDAASVCVQYQSWNLWILLQPHKYKSPSRKLTQLNNPKRDRKGGKADHMDCGTVTVSPAEDMCL